MTATSALLIAVLAASPEPAPSGRVISLEEAIATALAHQPTLRQQTAQTAVMRARAGEALSGASVALPGAGLLPEVLLNGTYQRGTGNFASSPGFLPAGIGGFTSATTPSAPTPFKMYNFYNFSVQVQQLLWDFGQVENHWQSTVSAADAQAQTELATRLTVILNVRTAYFAARAEKDLVQVAGETVENQKKHLRQTEGFVQVGTQPEIALAQNRTDLANARVQLITAENNYETGKAQLNTAMGIEGPTDYDVKDETLQEVPGEDKAIDLLLEEALSIRPEFKAIKEQIHSQELQLSSVKAQYLPSLGLFLNLTDRGTGGWGGGPGLPAGVPVQYLSGPEQYVNGQLNWNANAQITLSWPLLIGWFVPEEVHEQQALIENLQAQLDALRQQIRLAVDQTRLAVRAARENLTATDEALINARQQLRLAEGRYETGVGNIIELGDAQVAETNAAAQRVQADFNLASARAQFLQALGRP
jgi:outer membrane protein